jgi:hypothetical protein
MTTDALMAAVTTRGSAPTWIIILVLTFMGVYTIYYFTRKK